MRIAGIEASGATVLACGLLILALALVALDAALPMLLSLRDRSRALAGKPRPGAPDRRPPRAEGGPAGTRAPAPGPARQRSCQHERRRARLPSASRPRCPQPSRHRGERRP